MSTGYALGIDVGSTATKVVLCDKEGTIVARGSVPTHIMRPQPGLGGEWTITRCWEGVVAACRLALASIRLVLLRLRRIIGIGLTSLAPSVAPLAEDGTPLHTGIIYEDRRSVVSSFASIGAGKPVYHRAAHGNSDRERQHDAEQHAVAGGRTAGPGSQHVHSLVLS